MSLGLFTLASARIERRLVLQLSVAATLFAAAINPVNAAQNNSGRYVVPAGEGQWRAVDYAAYNGNSATFYPSWYAGVDIAHSEWESDGSDQDSTGAGLVLGNHFKPQWRWEVRHRYQDPVSADDGSGERHTLSSLALDYMVVPPGDGASVLLRAGMAQAAGDGLSSEQGDVQALLGLGLQWREGRWMARMMVEQMGEEQRWAGVTLAGYFGGGELRPRDKKASEIDTAVVPLAVPVPVPVPVPVAVPNLMEPISDTAMIRSVEQTEMQPRDTDQALSHLPVAVAPKSVCGDVFATRKLGGVAFTDLRSSELTDKSAAMLAQIGTSYARRSYINVQLELSARSVALAESRSESVIRALNSSGDLDGRIDSESLLGPDGVALIMKDGRRCR